MLKLITELGSRASMFTMKSSSLDEMPSGEEKDDKSSEEIPEIVKERILGVCIFTLLCNVFCSIAKSIRE